ncbi:MAG: hypothetical protein M3253_02415 [Chloroflexota bacterium]|nr:hypothetical protein [Chloroflexota bacterium]
MYQHPATLEMMAKSHQEELLRQAHSDRLARAARAARSSEPATRHVQLQRRLAAAAITVVVAFGTFIVVI